MNLVPIKANMTELNLHHGLTVLFSYRTPVAAIVPGLGRFKTSHYWSRTTTRHINAWLNGAAAEEKPQEYFDTLIAEVK
jgi:hypothetical protein